MTWRASEYWHELCNTVVCQVCGKRIPCISDEHLQSEHCLGIVKTVKEYKIMFPNTDILPCPPEKPKNVGRPKFSYRKTFKKGCHIGVSNGCRCPDCIYSSDKVTVSCAKIKCTNKYAYVPWDGSWICYSFEEEL